VQLIDHKVEHPMPEILRILLFEDNMDDALIIREILERSGTHFQLTVAETLADYLETLGSGSFDFILSDNGSPGRGCISAFEAARSKCPGVPFIAVSGISPEGAQAKKLKEIGATFVSKQQMLHNLMPAIEMMLSIEAQQLKKGNFVPYNKAMEQLIEVVQQLSLAGSLDAVMQIVRKAARELTGADGATFVLRDGDLCYYAEENAITPLWKGQRFPMSACISGWVMLNCQPAVIEDIYADERIPADAYRPTFVKSLVMVPIRTAAPIGAIGNYWAEKCRPPREVVKVLQALADITSVAMTNLQICQDLERRVKERTAELEDSNEKLRLTNRELAILNKELETFTGAVSHDLKAPLRRITSFSEMLDRRCAEDLDEKGKDYLHRVRLSANHMNELIDNLLNLSRATRTPVKMDVVDMSGLAREIASDLQQAAPERQAEFRIADAIMTIGDPGLLRTALENLLGNAWKYTSKTAAARIEFGAVHEGDGRIVYSVRDNGAGFDMEHVEKLFVPFQRLHSAGDFPGTGIGLTTVQRIICKHGGRIWAEGAVGAGAAFYFTLGHSGL